MADAPKGAAAKPQPYPKNWGSMNGAEKAAWHKKHRPNRDASKPVPPAALPTRQPGPAPVAQVSEEPPEEEYVPEEEKVPEEEELPDKTNAPIFTIQFPGREMVSCRAETFLMHLLHEVAAYFQESGDSSSEVPS